MSYYSLKRTLERFAHFPIKTSPLERKEPRLLLVTVDVKTGDAVTFDSYLNKPNTMMIGTLYLIRMALRLNMH